MDLLGNKDPRRIFGSEKQAVLPNPCLEEEEEEEEEEKEESCPVLELSITP
jgi:hypothetical protein